MPPEGHAALGSLGAPVGTNVWQDPRHPHLWKPVPRDRRPNAKGEAMKL